jgi:hypothetical protein
MRCKGGGRVSGLPAHQCHHALREVPKGPGEVRKASLRVTLRPGAAEAVGDVFDELAAGVEECPLAVGITQAVTGGLPG